MLATIGYERSTLADFVATLRQANVTTLVDVRERAQSRRAGFSKTSLAKAVEEVGIVYLHLPQLGDPKAGRDAARAGNMHLFQNIYSEVIASDAAQDALSQLEKLAIEQNICLMCFERNEKECHRKIVADALEKRLGIRASHWGVMVGASHGGRNRRVFHTDQGAATPI